MNSEFIPDPVLLKQLRTVCLAQVATELVALGLVVYLIATVNRLTYTALFSILACVLIAATCRQIRHLFASKNITAIIFTDKHVVIHKRIGKSLYEIGRLKPALTGNAMKLHVAGSCVETIDIRIFADRTDFLQAFANLTGDVRAP